MSINVKIEGIERCAICDKPIRSRGAWVFFFNGGKVAGAWHAKCGALPQIEGLTTKPHSMRKER